MSNILWVTMKPPKILMNEMKAAEAAGITKRVLIHSPYNEGIDDLGLVSLRVASLSDIYIQDIFI